MVAIGTMGLIYHAQTLSRFVLSASEGKHGSSERGRMLKDPDYLYKCEACPLSEGCARASMVAERV